MMDVIPAKDRRISKITEKQGAIFMESEAGVLRIIPQKGGIIRVSFSADGEFNKDQGCEYEDFSGSIEYKIPEGDFEVSENKKNKIHPDKENAETENHGIRPENCDIKIVTDEGEVRVNRESGAVSFYNFAGECLLSERGKNPRELERIPLYITVNADKAKVEEIVTPDGVKKKVKAADREEYGYAYKTRTYFEFADDEELIGFGQGEHGEWNLRHSTYYVHQGNRKIGIPMMVSSGKYGILFSTSSLLMFSENSESAFVQTEADCYLDYYFLFGETLFDVVRNYRRLTGKAAMLPMWAYGYMQSKERYVSQEDILETAAEFRKRNIGVDCLVLDWMSWEDNKWGQKSFDASRFPDPKAMTEDLHKKGIRFMMSIWPNMAGVTENNAEFKEKGLLLPGTDIYDAFSEEGRDLYWSQVERALLPAGVDAWWCDSSEPITPEWEHPVEPSDGEKYYEYKNDAANIMLLDKANAFGKYHARTIWEGQRRSSQEKREDNLTGTSQEKKEDNLTGTSSEKRADNLTGTSPEESVDNCTKNLPEKRVVNLTRSGWAGSQKYGTILWSGDISASWNTLQNQVKAALQFAASGMPYWTLDIGAFFVKHGIQWFWDGDYENGIDEAYKKLYVRWFEYGAFLPVFRAHGTDIEREPWAFGDKGDKYYEAICETIRNRYRLMPYIYSLGAAAHFDDGMMIRPLMFDFGDDEKAVGISDQFMFGDSLMVCPFVHDSKPKNDAQGLTVDGTETEDVQLSQELPVDATETGETQLSQGLTVDGTETGEVQLSLGSTGDVTDIRDVYLPSGSDWYELDLRAIFVKKEKGEKFSCKRYEGGQTIQCECDMDRIPVFVKAGSVIPTKKPLGCTDDMADEDIEVLIFPGADANFNLYEDAGDGYGYENGEYCITRLSWSEADKTFSWKTTGDEKFRRGRISDIVIG
ncbi:TIM-barrel domain-containing protein [Butyrivibrio sp. JL13D10]|uniref:glycoside hydrolase family 31 protein n=1 Tax=Butyrivibrio sp. JL13D10 TaxID=3236815 RepID=UPI0038B4D39D